MYATSVIERNVREIESHLNLSLIRVPVPKVDEWVDHLNRLRDEKGNLRRPLTPEEHRFIRNELLLSKLDYLYWAERYCWIIDDERRLSRLNLWHSQRRLFDRIASIESAVWDEYLAGFKSTGIRAILHKARQLGATAFSQSLMVHRCNFNPNVLALTASADDIKTQKVFDRAERMYDNMPWWMRGKVTERTKDRGMKWGDLDSEIVLQAGNQKSGVGMGETWEVGHLTECAAWDNPFTIEHDFFPAIARSPKTLVLLESTAQGRGNWWHQFTEQVRHGGSREWHYLFVPWYIEPTRYRAHAPDNWVPNENSTLHAKTVERTSPEFCGRTVILDRDQLYWYETEREQYRKSGALNKFLTNYCATPEESFQHSVGGAITVEQADELRLRTEQGLPYEIHPTPRHPQLYTPDANEFPLYRIPGLGGAEPYDPRLIDADPRGILWMYEPPRPEHTYVVAVDPSVGITGWSRLGRVDSDRSTDNGAITVTRAGYGPVADRVVATWFAPVDAEDLAPYVVFLGRLYRGQDETEALAIVEVQPGPGLLTQRRMINEFGYINLFQWQTLDSLTPKATASFGWYATPRSVRDLWGRGIRHIITKQVLIPCPHTIEELAGCYYDPVRQRGAANPPDHDDLVRTVMMSTWAIHDWNNPIQTNVPTQVTSLPAGTNWQATLMTAQQLEDDWDDRFSQMLEE